jgi:hypothetical protein
MQVNLDAWHAAQPHPISEPEACLLLLWMTMNAETASIT